MSYSIGDTVKGSYSKRQAPTYIIGVITWNFPPIFLIHNDSAVNYHAHNLKRCKTLLVEKNLKVLR